MQPDDPEVMLLERTAPASIDGDVVSNPTKRRASRTGPRAHESPGETLRAIERHVAANLDGDLSLATLARQARMSPSCFSRWFREQAGLTPHAYVLAARIDRAKMLLARSDRPILEIALAVGFSSQPCLDVAFRRRTGMTPTTYRRQVSTKTKDGDGGDVRRSPAGSSRRPASKSPDRRRIAR